MGLQKQLINLPLTDGVDTKTDSINLTPPKLAALTNMRFLNRGAITPRKQITTLTTFTPTTSGFITGLRDVIYAEVGDRLYQVADTTVTNLVSSWSPDTTLIQLGSSGVIQNGEVNSVSASPLDNGQIFTAWSIRSSTDDKFAYQFLSESGERLTGGSFILTSGEPYYFYSSAGPNNEGYIWLQDSGSVFRGYKVSGSTVTALTVPAITPGATFSIKWSSTDNKFFVLYSAGGSTVVNSWTVSGTTVTAGTATTLFAGFSYSVDVIRTTNYVVAAYWRSTGGVYCDFLSSSLVLSTSRLVTTDTTSYDRRMGFGITQIDNTDDVGLSYTPTTQLTGAVMSTFRVPHTTAITTFRSIQSVGFYCPSKPAYYNSALYAVAIDYVVRGAQTTALIRIADLVNTPSATLEVIGFWNSGTTTHPTSVSSMSSGLAPISSNIASTSIALYVPSIAITTVTSEDYLTTLSNGVAASNIVAFTVNGPMSAQVMKFSKEDTSNTVGYSHGTSSFIASTSFRGVDGTGVAPGCLWPNFSPLNMQMIAASTPISAGTYFFTFRKVWVDSLGNTQSLEGLPIRVTAENLSGTDYFRPQFYIPLGAFSLPNTSTGGAQYASIEVYRTETDGTIPYLAETLEYTSAGTYAFTTTNLNLSFALPSSSNELTTTPPPTIRNSVTWKGRIAALIGDSDTDIWYTKPTENYVFPAFTNGLQVSIPQSVSRLNALATMDGVLYAFNLNQVFTIYGDPASSTGEGSSLTIPEIRFNGVGCSQPKSVILTPKGIFFASAKGFYIILRNQELVFVGDGPFSLRDESILGAWCDEKASEVGFVFSDHMWVYDWEANAWAKVETALTDGYDITGGSLISHTLVLLNAAGIYQVTEEDVNEEFPISIETAWIHLAGLQDYQRVYRLQLLFTQYLALDHTLSIQLYIDYSDTVAHTWTIDSTTLGTLTPEQIDLSMPIQKCQAFRIKISSSVGGWKLHGINAEIGVKKSRYLNRQEPNSF